MSVLKFLSVATEKCDEKRRSKLNNIYDSLVEFYKVRFGYKPPNFNDFIEYMTSRDFRIEEKSNNNVYIYGLLLKDDSHDDEVKQEDDYD